MRLEKYHGLGNDFLVLVDLDGSQPVDAGLARAVCDRHEGVGADGLIRVTAGHGRPGGADVVMELWNADGSRAETSGNGLRCVARAVVDAGVVTRPELVIATDAGPRRATVDGGMVTVGMGEVAVVERTGQWDDLGPDDAHWSEFVDAGNPHVVFGVDDVGKVDLEQYGRAWDHHYPGGINVEYVTVGPGEDELTMRVWERGVGETRACGSGACAVAVAAERHVGLVGGGRVTVHQPGGDAVVDLSGDTVLLSGPAAHVFTADVEARK